MIERAYIWVMCCVSGTLFVIGITLYTIIAVINTYPRGKPVD